jgi:hypothetical protein
MLLPFWSSDRCTAHHPDCGNKNRPEAACDNKNRAIEFAINGYLPEQPMVLS